MFNLINNIDNSSSNHTKIKIGQIGIVLLIATILIGLLNQSSIYAQGPVPERVNPPQGASENQPQGVNNNQNQNTELRATQLSTITHYTPCENGFAADFPCRNLNLQSYIPLSDFSGTLYTGEDFDGSSGASDIWGWTDPNTGDEYALLNLREGTAFINITDPENPVYVGFLAAHGELDGGENWHDVKVYKDHAFIVSEMNVHGLQVFDLTQLGTITGTGSFPIQFTETAHFDGFGNAHNIAINEDTGYAYIVGTDLHCDGGLYILDIQDPLNPTEAGCFDEDGYTHDAQCVIYNGPDANYQGSEICFNGNEDTLTIVDVTDKANPTMLGRIGYEGASYAHQGWLTEDQVYFLFDDEADEQQNGYNTRTYIWDVSDLTDPKLHNIYTADNTSADHNLYVLGDLVYEANYRSGLRVLTLEDIDNTP